jgi:CubicO group peptidase (beta-lactamase class C family)
VARYLASLAGPGAGVLSRASLEEMWRPAHATRAGLPEFSHVGLGFFSLEADRRRIIGHTGDQAGYRSFLYLDPGRRTALVLVFNTTREGSAAAERLAALAHDGLSLLR